MMMVGGVLFSVLLSGCGTIKDTDQSVTHLNRGDASADRGDYDTDQSVAEAYVNRGIAYAQQGDYDRAIQEYD